MFCYGICMHAVWERRGGGMRIGLREGLKKLMIQQWISTANHPHLHHHGRPSLRVTSDSVGSEGTPTNQGAGRAAITM